MLARCDDVEYGDIERIFMTVTVNPSKVGGKIEAIASKTHAHRLLIAAALYGGGTKIYCRTVSEDILATAACLRGLGVRVLRQPYGFYVGTRETVGGHMGPLLQLDCAESGSTYRFLLPVACALGLKAVFKLGGRLPQRPMDELFNVLEEHGAVIEGKGSPELRISGRLLPGVYELPGDISSQYISGLLFALPLLEGESEIVILRGVESKGYIEATLSVLRDFVLKMELEGNRVRCKPITLQALCASSPKGEPVSHMGAAEFSLSAAVTSEAYVEGDWSNAAFWLVLGAVSGGPVTVKGLSLKAVQGDKAICDIIRRFGGEVRIEGDEVTAYGSGRLRGITLDASDIPDLVPAAAVLACAARGETKIVNAGRLRHKESDRLFTVAAVINGLGGKAEESGDGLLIHGGALRGGRVDSFNDHRIAMMGAIAAALCEDAVIITGAEAVNKSYPGFFAELQRLGGGLRFE